MKNYKVTRVKEEEKKPTRFFSSKQENKVAKTLGGKVTANSGATMFSKGDVKLEKFLIECKTRTSHCQSMSIQKEWLEKNEKEALFEGKEYSALTFNFGPEEKQYYIISEELFKELLEKL